jgi:hypothetical protein
MTSSSFHTRDPNLPRRNEVYLEILKLGLQRIRGAGYHGDHRHCEIEADHLHNVSAYIAGGDAANHLYYLVKEVPFYLTKVDLHIAVCFDLVRRYVPLWRELETLVPVEGSPWEKEWRELKATGWDYDSAAAMRLGRENEAVT